MKITAENIASMLGGTIEGQGDTEISGISKIDSSKAGTLSFLANEKYEKYIYECISAAVLVNKNFVPQKNINATLIRVDDAYASFAFLLEKYNESILESKKGISEKSSIAQSAKVSDDVYIGEFVVVHENAVLESGCKIFPNSYIGDNVKIGKNTVIYSGVKIYHACEVGENCIIHAGAVIGSDGFGHAPQADGTYKKIPQTGNVVIENNVEIGANTCLDRATIGSTIIRNGVKLDNLIQIAHNVEIGEHTVIAGLSGIAGSTKVGKHVMIGAQVGVAGHMNIANKTRIGAQSGIMNDIKEEGKDWIGTPVYEVRQSFRMQAAYRNLPEMFKKISELEKEIALLKEKKI